MGVHNTSQFFFFPSCLIPLFPASDSFMCLISHYKVNCHFVSNQTTRININLHRLTTRIAEQKTHRTRTTFILNQGIRLDTSSYYAWIVTFFFLYFSIICLLFHSYLHTEFLYKRNQAIFKLVFCFTPFNIMVSGSTHFPTNDPFILLHSGLALHGAETPPFLYPSMC